MPVLCIGLFLAGIWVLSRAFVIDIWQGPVFVLGILLVAAAMAIPIHTAPRGS